MVFIPYGGRLIRRRKWLNQYLHKKKCEDYYSLQTKEAHILAQSLLEQPDDRAKAYLRYIYLRAVRKSTDFTLL
jgi:hypothetical protein